jgi:hypothetical protein
MAEPAVLRLMFKEIFCRSPPICPLPRTSIEVP